DLGYLQDADPVRAGDPGLPDGAGGLGDGGAGEPRGAVEVFRSGSAGHPGGAGDLADGESAGPPRRSPKADADASAGVLDGGHGPDHIRVRLPGGSRPPAPELDVRPPANGSPVGRRLRRPEAEVRLPPLTVVWRCGGVATVNSSPCNRGRSGTTPPHEMGRWRRSRRRGFRLSP